jgi:hypothetical protein
LDLVGATMGARLGYGRLMGSRGAATDSLRRTESATLDTRDVGKGAFEPMEWSWLWWVVSPRSGGTP